MFNYSFEFIIVMENLCWKNFIYLILQSLLCKKPHNVSAGNSSRCFQVNNYSDTSKPTYIFYIT